MKYIVRYRREQVFQIVVDAASVAGAAEASCARELDDIYSDSNLWEQERLPLDPTKDIMPLIGD